jgi:hypothetical protein
MLSLLSNTKEPPEEQKVLVTNLLIHFVQHHLITQFSVSNTL